MRMVLCGTTLVKESARLWHPYQSTAQRPTTLPYDAAFLRRPLQRSRRAGTQRPALLRSRRETLAQLLTSFAARLVREISDPTVIAVFRLAIAEVVQAPEVARTLDSIGREASRVALRKIMAAAQEAGLLTGRPAELAEQFAALLWRDLMVSLLLGAAAQPSPRAIGERAREATAAFLRLHPA